MVIKEAKSFTVRIWIAGNLERAEEICREYCEQGMCVSITPMNYIYTGGEETGCVVTFINYPRFPRDPEDLLVHAENLAERLRIGLHQQSFSIEDPNRTRFFSVRPEDEPAQQRRIYKDHPTGAGL